MALLSQIFDIKSIPQQTNDFSPLPEGWYTATIKTAEIRDTKDKTGQYIAVRYDITGPTHQGRVVFGNINIKNKSTAAEEIGRQALGSIMRSIGLSRVDDTDQLIGGALQIKLSIRTQEGYEPTNDVRGYKALEGASMPKVTASEPVQDDGKVAPPWAKK
jgi:hypothetical protein